MPTLTYACEFNLHKEGVDAENYLASALRTWPEIYAELDGVKGTKLLANAFGLGGDFNYEWRVDIESLATLEVIDKALKSDDERWQTARREWFEKRSRVRARLTQRVDDESDESRNGDALQFGVTYHTANGSAKETRGALAETLRAVDGVTGVEHHAAVVNSVAAANHESWAGLGSLADLDKLAGVSNGKLGELVGPRAHSRLLSELQEVDGALRSGA
jgi:hypothetical protein